MYRFSVFFSRERQLFPSLHWYSDAILYRRIHQCLIQTSQQCKNYTSTSRNFQTSFQVINTKVYFICTKIVKWLCIKCNRIWQVYRCHQMGILLQTQCNCTISMNHVCMLHWHTCNIISSGHSRAADLFVFHVSSMKQSSTVTKTLICIFFSSDIVVISTHSPVCYSVWLMLLKELAASVLSHLALIQWLQIFLFVGVIIFRLWKTRGLCFMSKSMGKIPSNLHV
jgi:hypothetical protein